MDLWQADRSNGRNIIAKSVARVAKKQSPDDIEGFSSKVLANIQTTTDAWGLCRTLLTCSEKAVQGSDLVVEAIIENIKIKRDLFAFLDTKASWVGLEIGLTAAPRPSLLPTPRLSQSLRLPRAAPTPARPSA